MTNDTTVIRPGKDPIEFKMPKVAKSNAEFLASAARRESARRLRG